MALLIDVQLAYFCSSAGGLVTAVSPVVIECQGLWVGCTGLPDFQEEVYIHLKRYDNEIYSGLRCYFSSRQNQFRF
jgi:hypothetical protein